ncbi:MAG: aminotransferase class I/II-fold pyridoxal phosphate-dependent enzyme, partial [Dehalococcoidia bacterium]|nr:aminotransferase class I/II-fold pyridoxal phosphate-dependent enzyme [Dehalococcoidia bacterium]
MDGDIAPLAGLVELAERYDCLLMLDEAHAIGALGPGGKGLAASLGLEGRVPVLMGTLSKALGGFGGYAAGSAELRDFLVNTSRSFIFATALPPASAACAMAALDVLEESPELPVKLQGNAEALRKRLRAAGFNTLNSETQIIPVVVGDASRTVEMSRLLLERGILATAIRPPTVADGTSRVRVAVMATHTDKDLDLAADAFTESGRSLGVI